MYYLENPLYYQTFSFTNINKLHFRFQLRDQHLSCALNILISQRSTVLKAFMNRVIIVVPNNQTFLVCIYQRLFGVSIY